MNNPRLAGRYAKSLIELSNEKGQLEETNNDMLFIKSMLKASREFVTMLKSPVIPTDKKLAVMDALTKDKVSVLTASFNTLMINKGREEYLPEIVNAFVDMYNEIKGIHRVKLTTAQPVSEEMKKSIIDKFTATTPLAQIELETEVKEELVGGFILEFDNNLVDASIRRDLKDISKQFQENIYVQKIR